MRGLFDALNSAKAQSDWRPPTPPSLDGITEIELDFETTGVRWWAGDLPIGLGYALPDGRTGYLPWAHRPGGNLDEAAVAEWCKRELRGKTITNLNTRFEVHMAREWGRKWNFDLEEQNNTLSDVGHQAALLDDHRLHFSLASLVEDYLEDERKIQVVEGIPLNVHDMASHHASIVAVRAEADVRQVQKLKRYFRPQLEKQDLLKVKELEDHLIWVTAAMEAAGTKIDLPLLDRWLKQVRKEIDEGLQEIGKLLGRAAQSSLFEGGGKTDRPFNPDSPRDMEMLFKLLKLPISLTEKKKQPSFTAAVMKSHDHPTVKKVFRLGKLIDVESKLATYWARVDHKTGVLRYALHQLRAQKDELDDYGSAGTVSGRYSSTKIQTNPDEGVNIQQVWKPEQQRKAFGYSDEDDTHDDDIYIIRQLHIPARGYHLRSDAMQIEYRLFANDTESERLIAAYRENPLVSYHKMIHAQLLPFKPDLAYRRCKDTNFAKQYGAGIRKMALMLEFISAEKYHELNNRDDWFNDPSLDEVKEINRMYNRAVPEVAPLLEKAKHLAMPRCNDRCKKIDKLHQLYEHRGFIKTILGRRTRFPNGQRVHKALNARIQGSAADIMKQKLVELHDARKTTGFTLRFTVHDEVDGDVPNRESAELVNEILNRQSFKTKVPILWEVGIGPNWKQLEDIPVIYEGKKLTS
jgi:DNA polymerase I-like protein with 3'-5' exonuclease and polymerase domains